MCYFGLGKRYMYNLRREQVRDLDVQVTAVQCGLARGNFVEGVGVCKRGYPASGI